MTNHTRLFSFREITEKEERVKLKVMAFGFLGTEDLDDEGINTVEPQQKTANQVSCTAHNCTFLHNTVLRI